MLSDTGPDGVEDCDDNEAEELEAYTADDIGEGDCSIRAWEGTLGWSEM